MPEGRRSGSTAALLAAAGIGSRLGRGPKAYLDLAGETLLERAAAAVAPLVDELIIAAPADSLNRARSLVPDALVLPGGGHRQESVLAMLEACRAELVVVHDVARPFLPRAVFERARATAAESGAATAAVTVADTLVRTDGETVDRSELRAIQTPQAFRRELLLRAHLDARSAGFGGTDDAVLVRRLGEPVALVEGSPWLFKLTNPGDLTLAEALAPAWDRARGTG